MVPGGNKANYRSSVNHTTKAIHHHHHFMCMSMGASLFAVVCPIGTFVLSSCERNVTSAGANIAASSSSDLIDARANFVDGCEACFQF